jgi:putative ABC transport system permease protein
MNLFRQVGAVTSMNFRSLPQRASTSLVIVIGIAGVVAVLVSVLAMSTGMIEALQNTGRDDRAIVLRNGSTTEISSALSRDAAPLILDAPGVKRGADGKAIASTEGMRMVNLQRKEDNAEVGVAFRGVSQGVWALRPEMKLVEGRVFQPAVNEVIVGKALQSEFKNLEIGDKIRTKQATWTVVGVFSSGGDFHESELIADVDTMNSADQRGYQTITVLLESPGAMQTFKDSLSANPALAVDVERESEFFARQSETIGKIIRIVAYIVGGIMAIGAIFSALNTMYSAVSARVREIATLRALGFGSFAMVISVLAEALLLSLIGGVLGAFIAFLFFNGHRVSTSAGSQGTHHLVFELAVNWQLVTVGIVWSCVIGLIGGLLPAIRAARLPVAKALNTV